MAPKSCDTCPEFFKAFNPEVSSVRMQIPVAFNEFFGKSLPRDIILLNRTRNMNWEITLTKEGSNVFFDKGWKRFVQDNDLKLGEFLVFKFEGSGIFEFGIFDQSGCEVIRDWIKIEDSKEEEEDVDSDSSYSIEEEKDYDSLEIDALSQTQTSSEQEARKSFERKKKGRTSCVPKLHGLGREPGGVDDPVELEKHLEDPKNPFFVVKGKKSFQLIVIKDHKLKFPETEVSFVDEMGELKGNVKRWKDGRVCISRLSSIWRHNRVRTQDSFFCECVTDPSNCVRLIKVRVLRADL